VNTTGVKLTSVNTPRVNSTGVNARCEQSFDLAKDLGVNQSETDHTHNNTTKTTPQTNNPTNHPPPPHTQSTTLKGRATTVRTTTHARVGGRAEVSVGGWVQVRRAPGRARVRRATAGLQRTRQLEASRVGMKRV